MIKVRAHTCYLGKTGYAAHAREFFRELSNFIDLRVRNYTWDDSPEYLNETDFSIIDLITLSDKDSIEKTYPISHAYPKHPWKLHTAEFKADVDIVLVDTDHHYFYEEYTAPIKIAYTVWESTKLPDKFFNRLLEFDYLWTVSEWHRQMAILQGYPQHRVFVVNEGVDEIFFSSEKTKLDKFTCMFFGRWDYRKAVPEILQSFSKAFPNNEEVELIISADNPFSVDGLKTTEERLAKYEITDSRIKPLHFLERKEYVSLMHKGHLLITCARSEGWNIPLIEAMAAGTPTIYSNWGAQLEFTKGEGTLVEIKEELPAALGAEMGFAGYAPGNYAEPNWQELTYKIREVYDNYEQKKKDAEEIAIRIRRDFNWKKISSDAYSILKKLCGYCESKIESELVVVMSHADTLEKERLLFDCVNTLKSQGYTVAVSTHIQISDRVEEKADAVILDSDNPVILSEEYLQLSKTVPIHYMVYPSFELTYSFDFNHGFAALKLIKNGIGFAEANDFNKIHFVNYDYIMNDAEVLISHSRALRNGNDVVAYVWNGELSINTGFLSAKTSVIKEATFSIKNKKDYFRWEEKVILEDVMYAALYEIGATVDYRGINHIEDKNYLNCVVSPTCPQVNTKNGERFSIFICEEKGKFYLGIRGSESEKLKIRLNIPNLVKNEFTADGYPMLFIEIPYLILENGFTVDILGYDTVMKYDLKTKRASCKIIDLSIIRKLDIAETKDQVIFSFIGGAKIEIKGESEVKYQVEFIDLKNNVTVYQDVIGTNCWAKASQEYYTEWLLRAKSLATGEVYEHHFEPTGKRVLVHIDSKALGDTLSWFPHIEEFRKKTGAEVWVSTFKNELYEKTYQHINFVSPGKPIQDLYASYSIGWFYNGDEPNYNMHPKDFRKQPMQATTTDILGLEYFSLPPVLSIPEKERPIREKYICIGMHSTAQAKYWNNPHGWQEVTDYFLQKGWKVVMLSLEENGYMGNYYPIGVSTPIGARTLENAMVYLKYSEMFIGISSGLSWLAWAVGTPTALISGWSWPCTEVLGDRVIRIFKGGSCNGCFNRKRLDPGDWNFCPDQKGTARQFECSRLITGKDVITEIEKYFEKGIAEKSSDVIVQESYELGMVQNYKEIIKATDFIRSQKIENFMEIGTDQGGTFAIWSKVSKEGIRISLDLPHGNFGRQYNLQKRDEYLKSLGKNVHLIHGNSHLPEIKEKIMEILGEIKLDFLFIDGDHTYEGVKQDFEMYKEFVKPGGWIGFHDIKDTQFHRNANCRVDLLWNELAYEKIEYCDPMSDFGGIGFIQV